MRNLFLLLVLVNLTVLAYFQWVIERPEPPAPYSGPGITLLREVDPDIVNEVLLAARQRAETTRTDNLSPASREPTSDQVCTSIGPFSQPGQVESATATLLALGYRPSRRQAAGTSWLDVSHRAQDSISPELLQTQESIGRLEQIPCP